MVTYCTASQVGSDLGLPWADEDSVGSDTLVNTVFLSTSVGRKYQTGFGIRLYNSNGSSEDATITSVTYGTSYTSLSVGSLTNYAYFTTAKSSTCQIKSYFTGTSRPTQALVNRWIEDSESEINDYTRRAWGNVGSYSGYIRWDPRRTHVIGDIYEWYKVKLPYPDPVTPLSSASGDSLKVWDGSSETERLGTWTEGRTNDYWLDGKQYMYINSVRPWPGNNAIFITYRYGKTAVPYSIRQACSLLTQARWLQSNRNNNTAMVDAREGESTPYQQSNIQLRNMAYTLLKKRRRLIFG